jgi:hypothetical protein
MLPLEVILEEVDQHHDQSALYSPALASPHVLNLLDKMSEINFSKPSSLEQRCLLLRPGVIIPLIQVAL